MTSYESLPGHSEIQYFMDNRETSVSSLDLPLAPPCSVNTTNSIDNASALSLETQNLDQGQFKCRICTKSFHHWTSLHTHELIHTGKSCRKSHPKRRLIYQSSGLPGRLSCPDCGKLYASKMKLRVHQRRRHYQKIKLLLYI